MIYTVMSGLHMKRVGWRLFFRTLVSGGVRLGGQVWDLHGYVGQAPHGAPGIYGDP